jgi:beta-N-acetylhexosaminidase
VSHEHSPLIVGIPGPHLGPEEIEVLEAVRPVGVILFGRNIVSTAQVRDLATGVRELSGDPFLAVDLEGGMVNRLAALWGTLPSAQRAGAAGRKAVRTVGEAAGAACRRLGIQLDLAPVVDLSTPGGLLAAQGRCLSDDTERVAALAAVFLDGLHSWCVGGCVKHYPGLGTVAEDTHETLPTLDLTPSDLAVSTQPFRLTTEQAGAVMMAHVRVPGIGDPNLPASLDPALVERAASLPGNPTGLSDDLDMGALTAFGTLPELAEAALRAGNHGLLICNSWRALPAVAEHLRDVADKRPGFRARTEEAVSRLVTLSRELCRAFAAEPAPDDRTVAQLWEQARKEAEP